MHQILATTLLAILFFACLYGWGRLAERLLGMRQPAPFAVCTGMAVCIFIGGILNLAAIAFGPVLDAMVVTGLVLAAVDIVLATRRRPTDLVSQMKPWAFVSSNLPVILIIAAAFVFAAAYLSCSNVFNYHDDFETYLPHPVRMLQSGTLAGSSFNGLGSLTLGGQAFLQAFVVAHFPLRFVHCVDAVFGFTLTLMLAASGAKRSNIPGILVPMTISLAIFINPQCVNISAVYMGTALILWIFLGPWLRWPASGRMGSWPECVMLAMVYSALVTLKTTYVPVVVVHFSLVLMGFLFAKECRKAAPVWFAKVLLSSAVFILPWILLYRSGWFELLAARAGYGQVAATGIQHATTHGVALFSLQPLHWGFGATFAHYTVVVVLLALGGLLTIRQKDAASRVYAFSACAVLPILYLPGVYILGNGIMDPCQFLRYMCPVIIAGAASGAVMASVALREISRDNSNTGPLNRYSQVILGFIIAVVLVSFLQSTIARARQAIQYGSTLSFPWYISSEEYRTYNADVLSCSTAQKIRRAQNAVPPGKSIGTWTTLAVHLDFGRNRIIEFSPGGIGSPTGSLVLTAEPNDILESIHQVGVEYLLWQHSPPVRDEGDLIVFLSSPYSTERDYASRNVSFISEVEHRVAVAKAVYDRDGIRIVQLSAGDSSRAK